MADAPTLTPFDRQCLDALKSLGKTLGQMTLYKIGHPAVAATLKIAEEHLSQALGETGEGGLLYSFDHEKVIANGRIIGTVDQLPSSIRAMFTRFKLASLTFKKGLANSELVLFCELAAGRADGLVDPNAYLGDKGVTHIAFTEAVYTKMSEEALIQTIESRSSLDEIIQALIGTAISDAKQQRAAFDKVTKLLADDIHKRVEEVVKPLQHEKTQLANESARTQSVLQNMVEGVVMVDEQGKILMMNPAAEQLYGATLAEVAGQHLTAKAGEEHMVTLAQELTTPGDREISKDVGGTAPDADAKKTIKASAAVVQNQEGKVVGVVSQLSDVSKHKELQRMQRDFIAHVTHELRSPLASIRAAMEILQGEVAEKLRDEENRMLNTALKNADRLGDLINSILDFSKIESGQMTVFPKKMDPERIAREGVDSLAAWASKKRLTLALVTAPDLPPVMADSPRVVQVLVNLISNAIKFTPVGGSITVRVQRSGDKETGAQLVQYSVTDTGPGIPKKEQKKVFEKFVQIAAGETHVGGTGLGLSIAKALVHLHGGKMWLESDEGKGASFLFTLPVYTPPREATKTTPVTPPPAPKPWWKKLFGGK